MRNGNTYYTYRLRTFMYVATQAVLEPVSRWFELQSEGIEVLLEGGPSK